jgi:hypothetical protein
MQAAPQTKISAHKASATEDQVATAAIAHRLADALAHVAGADRTEAHWAWHELNDEQVLFRVYPLYGVKQRQDDVTLFSAKH